MSKSYHITNADLTFIRDNRTTMTIPEIAAAIGKSGRSVSLRLKEMGMATEVKPPLTAEQREFVRANAGTMTQRAMADHLGCSQHTVNRLVRKFGIERRKGVPGAISDAEREYLRTNWLAMTDAQLAAELGRSVIAIQSQRQKMGLKREQQRPGPKPKAKPAHTNGYFSPRSVEQPKDTADRAAEHIASYDRTPVFRIADDGKPHPKGKLWRYGTTRLTTEQMLAKAYRKGFDPDAWRRLAA